MKAASLALIIMTLSLNAFAETKNTKNENEDGATSRMIQKKRAKMRGLSTSSAPEQQDRPKVNNDFDPQKGAIDSKMTKDEGMEND